MKRITVFLLACVLALGGIGAAKADGIDVKVRGEWDFSFGWVNNKGFKDSVLASPNQGGPDDDNFEARQRIRTQINFITSEYLQAVLMFEIGGLDWGRPGTDGPESGGALDADGVNIETRRAYLDWLIPNTKASVRMGIQYLALPSTRMGSTVFGADVAGIVVSSPITDWLSATAFWVRPFDQYRNSGTWDGADNGGNPFNGNYSDAVDTFGLVLPVSMEGWSVSPYFLYGFVGANSGLYDYLYFGDSENTVTAKDSRAKAWWLGTNVTLDIFDPLSFSLDAVYGHLNKADLGGLGGDPADPATSPGMPQGTQIGTRGWFLAATLDYTLDFMTPGIFGWWASGDRKSDVDDGMFGRIPVVGVDDGFTATSFGMAGYAGVGNGADSVTVSQTAAGTWGVGIQLADITFIEKLSHTLRVAYYRGTNDSDLVRNNRGEPIAPYFCDPLYLTDKDSVWEVNFDHQYNIYENLTAVLELGYLRLKADRGVWHGSGLDETDDAWKAEVTFSYSF